MKIIKEILCVPDNYYFNAVDNYFLSTWDKFKGSPIPKLQALKISEAVTSTFVKDKSAFAACIKSEATEKAVKDVFVGGDRYNFYKSVPIVVINKKSQRVRTLDDIKYYLG